MRFYPISFILFFGAFLLAGTGHGYLGVLSMWASFAYRRYAIVDRADKLDALRRQEEWEKHRKEGVVE